MLNLVENEMRQCSSSLEEFRSSYHDFIRKRDGQAIGVQPASKTYYKFFICLGTIFILFEVSFLDKRLLFRNFDSFSKRNYSRKAIFRFHLHFVRMIGITKLQDFEVICWEKPQEVYLLLIGKTYRNTSFLNEKCLAREAAMLPLFKNCAKQLFYFKYLNVGVKTSANIFIHLCYLPTFASFQLL